MTKVLFITLQQQCILQTCTECLPQLIAIYLCSQHWMNIHRPQLSYYHHKRSGTGTVGTFEEDIHTLEWHHGSAGGAAEAGSGKMPWMNCPAPVLLNKMKIIAEMFLFASFNVLCYIIRILNSLRQSQPLLRTSSFDF